MDAEEESRNFRRQARIGDKPKKNRELRIAKPSMGKSAGTPSTFAIMINTSESNNLHPETSCLGFRAKNFQLKLRLA